MKQLSFLFKPSLILVFFVSITASANAQGNPPILLQSCVVNAYETVFGPGFAAYIPSIAGLPGPEFYFASPGGLFEAYSDSTAHLSGTIRNSKDTTLAFDVNIWFYNRMDWNTWSATGGLYFGGSTAAQANHQFWNYYQIDDTQSTLIGIDGFAGDTLMISHYPTNFLFAAQVGSGANDKNINFGLSFWFLMAPSAGSTIMIQADRNGIRHGDFNLDADCSSPGGNEICSFTQGFYGNSGGKFCKTSTLTLINRLLSSGPIVLGGANNNITFGINDAQCIIDRLPGGGKGASLNGTATCTNPTGIQLHKKSGRFKNNLLAQSLTLALNMRLSSNLGGWTLPGLQFETLEMDNCTPNAKNPIPGTSQKFYLPQNVLNELGAGATVQDLFELANEALDGKNTGKASLGDLISALSTVNEGFDECRVYDPNNRNREELISGSEEIEFRLYPNPNNGMFSIETGELNGPVQVRILNYLGSEVKSFFINESDQKQSQVVEIQIPEVKPGTYIFSYTKGDRVFYKKMVILN